MEIIGKGQIRRSNNQPVYRGTMPFPIGTDVYVVKQTDLDRILRNDQGTLLMTRHKMDKELFEDEMLPDLINAKWKNEEVSLYLDRHIYGFDDMDAIFIRYCTIDRFLSEERP